MQTVVVWAEDEDRSGVETGLASVTDRLLVQSADKLTQPSALPFIAGIYCGTEKATHVWVDGRLSSPGLNGVNVNELKLHKGFADNHLDNSIVYDFFANPIAGVPGQEINAYSLDTDEAGVAHFNHIAMILSNKRLPYTPPRPVTHLASATIGAVAASVTWESKTFTLDYSLPSGMYYVHGIDLVSDTIIAARITGLEKTKWPPAIIPRRSAADAFHPFNRNIGGDTPYVMNYMQGGTLPIKLEVIAEATDTALSAELYLQKVG